MNIIGVIPARWASSRFPGKSLALLRGKPLLQWVVERSRLAKRLSALYVATDDDRIMALAEKIGVRAVMTRPDHESGTDRVAEAVALAGGNCDGVVNIQGDEPMIDPDLIDGCVDVMSSECGWDMVTAASPLHSAAEAETPSVCKVVFDAERRALYFSRSVIPSIRDDDFRSDEPIYWRHIGIYLYRTPFLVRLVAEHPCLLERAEKLEQLRALHIGGRIRVILASGAARGIDTPADLHALELEMERLGWS